MLWSVSAGPRRGCIIRSWVILPCPVRGCPPGFEPWSAGRDPPDLEHRGVPGPAPDADPVDEHDDRGRRPAPTARCGVRARPPRRAHRSASRSFASMSAFVIRPRARAERWACGARGRFWQRRETRAVTDPSCCATRSRSGRGQLTPTSRRPSGRLTPAARSDAMVRPGRRDLPHGHRRRGRLPGRRRGSGARRSPSRRSGSTPLPVTNARFAAFVARRPGTVTAARAFGWSFVFGGLLPDDFRGHARGRRPRRGGARCIGADWAHPEGPAVGSRPAGPTTPSCTSRGTTRAAYCTWAGHAAADRGGVGVRGAAAGSSRQRFPWGSELEPGGEHRMNVWQGEFPGATTPGPTVGTAPRRSTRSRRTGTASSTSPATCGSGAPTGSRADYYAIEPGRRPLRPAVGDAPGDARRLVPLPRVVLQPLPRRGSEREHSRRLDRQPRLPGA